jgi:putative endonuclease
VGAYSEMYYVYLLKSMKSKWIYIGMTSELERRFKEHEGGKSRSTRPYLPVQLAYYEAYRSEIDAKRREKRLKQYGNSLGLLKKRITNSLQEKGTP